ncbi:MAG: thioredoxin family protein [Burkholderiaceae bacterium]|jgi:small redox-active disulfide protein 2|nr:thioredoxin family protein [Burkholderiaceae bacterium]
MEIKIFGPGCARCAETEKLIKEAAAAQGGNITVQKVSDLKEMMAAGIMSTPAVAVDGVVKSTGRIPAMEEVAAWISGGSCAAPSSCAPDSGCCCR